MTKWRDPYSLEAALTEIISELGDSGAAEVVGKSERLVYMWSNPDEEVAPKLSQALHLDVAYVNKTGKQAPLLTAYQGLLSRYARFKPVPVESIEREALDVAAETGDLARAVREANADETITPNEARQLLEHCARIEREVAEVRQIAEAVLDNSVVPIKREAGE